MREILCEKSSHRNYRTLPETAQERIKDCVEAIASTEEVTQHPKVTHLRGPSESVYRARIGEYRVVFTCEHGTLRIWELDNRKNVYQDIDQTYAQV